MWDLETAFSFCSSDTSSDGLTSCPPTVPVFFKVNCTVTTGVCNLRATCEHTAHHEGLREILPRVKRRARAIRLSRPPCNGPSDGHRAVSESSVAQSKAEFETRLDVLLVEVLVVDQESLRVGDGRDLGVGCIEYFGSIVINASTDSKRQSAY